ncbi:MAG: aspartate/tyrosine/aromatic aminotransferase [Rhodobacteraceae bacterium]|nr:aspartate/tyrosine/aromatic aminotransferase [Paracoccaceae bacterium]
MNLFDKLPTPKAPKILQLLQDFAIDPRENKIDLGIGVYKDESGITPVLKSVKKAEAIILEQQKTKAYIGLAGDPIFCDLASELVIGDVVDRKRINAIQTPGGSTALRVLYDLVSDVSPNSTIWLPAPTWDNHAPTIKAAGLKANYYRYFNPQKQKIDFELTMKDLRNIPAGDVVLIHGCCHNPTGVNFSDAQWDSISELALDKGFLPLVDIAYQGFGIGLNEDAYGVRKLLSVLPELLIASSSSKNFAIYRDRAGVAITLSKNETVSKALGGKLKNLAGTNYSMPPDHGAAVVRTILSDSELKTSWLSELDEMRERVHMIRRDLSLELRNQTNSSRFDFLAEQAGMFSLIGLTKDEILRLKDEKAIYIVDDGRINIAGLRSQDITKFAGAVREIISN